ncbi:MAG: hypothetical protein HKN72_13100 [Gemmatimonadetes bacterium]|nr:hypothetical protein [Gemmatimonadota bacterium]
MTSPPLWDRLRRARIVQVLIVYLGASWAVLQVADTLTEALSLPEWVSPVTIILLLVGLVIILATAWVQSLPSTTAAEEAGERPTDWEIAPGQAVESLKAGRLPALTWGRAILGGVVALSLLFGGTGLYVGLTGGPSFLGPTEAGATDAAEGIAVLPFTVSGVEDDAFWGEGMVDLLSTNLDGMGGFRAIDSRTVLARWREAVDESSSPDLNASLRIAGATGARYAVIGSARGVGGDLRLVTSIYDLGNGQEVGQGQVQGSQSDPMKLIDDLSLETMRQLLSGGGEDLATARNLADLTTASVPALRAYLEGERYYRRAEFPQAVEAYERALEEDSTFALALFRISDAYGWLEDIGSERAIELGALSIQHKDRLSPRNEVIVTAGNALYTGDLSHLEPLEAAVRKYPDDPEAWFMLAELYIHMGEATRASAADALEAIERAIELDPSFAPYYVHAIDRSIAVGDTVKAARYMDQYGSFSETDVLQGMHDVAYALYLGDDEALARGWTDLDRLSDQQQGIFWGTYGLDMPDAVRTMEVADYMHGRTGEVGWARGRARWTISTGQWEKGESLVRDSIPGGPSPQTIYLFHTFTNVDVGDLLPIVRACEPGAGCTLWRGALAADEGNWADHEAMVVEARTATLELREGGDEIQSRFPNSIETALMGYRQLLDGDPVAARRTLEEGQGLTNGVGDEMTRYWLAMANEEVGRTEDALRWYQLLTRASFRSVALARAAAMAEESGNGVVARELWTTIARNYREADEGHPGAAEADAALERLGPTQP